MLNIFLIYIYKSYILSGGKGTSFLVLLSLIGSQGFKMLIDWWIGKWSKKEYDLTDG